MDSRELRNLVNLVCLAYSPDEFHELVEQVGDFELADLNTDDPLRTQVWEFIRWLRRRGPRQLLSFARLASELRQDQPDLRALVARLENGSGSGPPTSPAHDENGDYRANGGDGSGVTPVPLTSEKVGHVVKAVEVVEDWRRHPRMLHIIVMYKQDVKATSRRIDLLARYKALHDCLHQLQFTYDSLERATRRLSEPHPDPDAVQEVEAFLANIYREIEKARAVAKGLPARDDELTWVEEITEVVSLVGKALEPPRDAAIQAALRRLKRVIRREPSRINQLLVLTAKELPLTSLLRLLDEAGTVQIPGLPLQQIHEAHASLQGLERDVQEHIEVHRLWQILDHEIWQADEFIRSDLVEEFLEHWHRIKKQLRQLGQRDPLADWVSNLESTAEAIDQAFMGADTLLAVDSLASARHWFGRYRTRAVNQFFYIDLTLKTKCDMITEIGQPLRKLLVETAHAN